MSFSEYLAQSISVVVGGRSWSLQNKKKAGVNSAPQEEAKKAGRRGNDGKAEKEELSLLTLNPPPLFSEELFFHFPAPYNTISGPCHLGRRERKVGAITHTTDESVRQKSVLLYVVV